MLLSSKLGEELKKVKLCGELIKEFVVVRMEGLEPSRQRH